MDAKIRLIKNRLKRLISYAEREGYQFIIADDEVLIGSKKLESDWDSLYGYPQRNIEKFESTGEVIIAVGA